jgi:O-antigen/teichoic acid export membrane protein
VKNYREKNELNSIGKFLMILNMKIYPNKFVKNFTTLVSGTFIAQAVALLLMPVLSRMYGQVAFGILASFQAILGIAYSVGVLGYHAPIVIEPEERKAEAIMKLCLFLSIGLSVLVTGILYLPIDYFETYKHLEIAVGITVFLQLMNLIYTQWNIRHQQFRRNAVYHIIQSIAMFVFQLILFYLFSVYGLVLGLISGYFVSNLYMRHKTKISLKGFPKDLIHGVAKRYIDFPKYFVPANSIDSFSSHLPVIFLTSFFSLEQIGLYGLSYKVMMQPVSLISANVNSILLSEMSKRKNNTQPVSKMYMKLFFCLLIAGVLFALCIITVGENFFAFVFGKEWRESGTIAIALTPLFIALFIKGMGNAMVRVFEKQPYMLKYAIASLVFRASALLIGYICFNNFNTIVLIYSLTAATTIIIGELYLCWCVKNYDKKLTIKAT